MLGIGTYDAYVTVSYGGRVGNGIMILEHTEVDLANTIGVVKRPN